MTKRRKTSSQTSLLRRLLLRSSLACVLYVSASAGIAGASGPGRYAVVVGINDYADTAIPDLKYAESDARSVYDTLTDAKIGRFPQKNVTLLLGKDVTPGKIKAALYKLRGVGKDDLVVIFYSGHGAKEGDEAFWVTQDADHKALPATSLTNSEIRKYLQRIPSQRMVVLLDCCYAASTTKKSLTDPKKLFGEFEGKGRATIAGSADNQEALEYEGKKAGVFTHYLVSGLRGAADTNSDGVVTFEEVWRYLGDNVRKASVKQGGLHEPVLISEGGITPQFLLTFNPKVQVASL
jgi:metacaspase-1